MRRAVAQGFLPGIYLWALLVTSCGGGSSAPVAPPAEPNPTTPPASETPSTPAPPVDTPDPPPPPATPPATPPADPPPVTPPPVEPPAPGIRNLSGTVLTPQLLPIPDTTILVQGVAQGLTDSAGHFALVGLPDTPLLLAFEAEGYYLTTFDLSQPGDFLDLHIELTPLSADELPTLSLAAQAGFGEVALTLPVPGANLPYDYFFYRRIDGSSYDFAAPLNTEPLRQVAIEGGGEPASVIENTELTLSDGFVAGGEAYFYTARARDLMGRWSTAAPEVGVQGRGFGPATALETTPDFQFLDAAAGAEGELLVLYRDLTYQPWHRFVVETANGLGTRTELFRSEGVYDDAELFVDRFGTPSFVYRRNGIEFLFETYLLNFWDPLGGVGPDIKLGLSNRRIDGELAAQLLSRPDPEGVSPAESVMTYINRDGNLIARTWDYGQHLGASEVVLGDAHETLQPRLQSLANEAGDVVTIWNRDFSDLSYWWIGGLDGNVPLEARFLAHGSRVAPRLGRTADDQFLVALVDAIVGSTIHLYRYRGDGSVSGQASIDLAPLGLQLPAEPTRLVILPLPNGLTVLGALVEGPAGRAIHIWEVSDFEAIDDLGTYHFAGGATPSAIELLQGPEATLHLVSIEGGLRTHRKLFW